MHPSQAAVQMSMYGQPSAEAQAVYYQQMQIAAYQQVRLYYI